MTKRWIYPLLVFLAGTLWGSMGILVRSMNSSGFNSMEIVTFRAIITAVIMVLFLGIKSRKELKIKLKDIWCFIGTGIFSIVFFNVCYFSSMNYMSLGVAAILLYTAPTFVSIMSFFLFKEKFGLNKIISLVLAFVGCAFVSGGFEGAALSFKGLLLGLGSGFGYALYSIFGKYAIKRGYSSYTITAYTFLFATVGTLPFINIGHFVNTISESAGRLPYNALLVILNTVLAYILYTKGISGMENGKASIIASIEPVVAAIIGIAMYDEKLTPLAICGICIVILSQAVSLWHGNKKEN